MKRRQAVSAFGATAATLGAAAALSRACPGTCTSCTSCAAAIVPMVTTLPLVGLAIAGSYAARRRDDGRRDAGSRKHPTPRDGGA